MRVRVRLVCCRAICVSGASNLLIVWACSDKPASAVQISYEELIEYVLKWETDSDDEHHSH